MSGKVLYLPGVMGSVLASPLGPGLPDAVIWFDPAVLLAGGWTYLDLAADGVSPGPLAGGRVITTPGIWYPAYGPLAGFLRFAGYDVLEVGYDWRTSVLTSAAKMLDAVVSWAGGIPFAVLAHSLGGLVARALYVLLGRRGLAGLLARLVTIGSPHYGSMSPVSLWYHQPFLYTAIVRGLGWVDLIPGRSAAAWCDAVLASHPAWYEATSFRDYGPLYNLDPSQSAGLYNVAYLGGANAFLSQARMNDAAATQTELMGQWPHGATITVCGTGHQTAYALAQPGPLSAAPSYLYTPLGDGTVTEAEASLPGCPAPLVSQRHALQCLDPGIWQRLPGWLSGPLSSAASA